jgi:hypothetical protein
MNTQTPITTPRTPGRNKAVEWLAQYLKDGPKLAGEGRAAAHAQGIGLRSLAQARRILGVKKHTENGIWVGWRRARWELPPGPLPRFENKNKNKERAPVS